MLSTGVPVAMPAGAISPAFFEDDKALRNKSDTDPKTLTCKGGALWTGSRALILNPVWSGSLWGNGRPQVPQENGQLWPYGQFILGLREEGQDRGAGGMNSEGLGENRGWSQTEVERENEQNLLFP